MQYIENNSVDPTYNLALEEYVVKNLEPQDRFIILWQNEPSVIIGRFQNTAEEINSQFIAANNINVVRRMTGGGAVYHDLGNLNFSFIEKTDNVNIDFRKYNERIINALSKLGIKAEHNSRNDIAIEGKKFSGNAQYIHKGKVLHHGTLLFNSDLANVQAALNVNPDKFSSKAVKSVRSRVTNIAEYLQGNTTVEDFKEILLKSLFVGEIPNEYKLSVEDLNGIKQLQKEKYSTWEWNYGSSPVFNFKKSQRFTCGKIDVRIEVDKSVIKNIKIYGDFFSSGDINDIEELLKGSKYLKEEINNKFKTINLENYFGQITTEEFLTCFFD